MAQMDLKAKLAILADAAKYDASCASSGTAKRDSRDGKGLGSTEGMGICHAYAPDGAGREGAVVSADDVAAFGFRQAATPRQANRTGRSRFVDFMPGN